MGDSTGSTLATSVIVPLGGTAKVVLPGETSSAAPIHRARVRFSPAILAIDIASLRRRKRNRILRAALGACDVVAGAIILKAAASLILKGHVR